MGTCCKGAAVAEGERAGGGSEEVEATVRTSAFVSGLGRGHQSGEDIREE